MGFRLIKKYKNIDNARIGVALGSGSARGWAHIGVLQALSEQGIEPDFVAGSSIGALVGAVYASDHLNEMEQLVTSLNWKDIVSYLDMSVLGGGLIEGDKLVEFLPDEIGDLDITALPRRFSSVATELNTGREVWMQEGCVLDAVRASMALPGIMTPFNYNGRWLVDGGLVDPVPVSLCRAMGADIVIAVSLNGDIVGKHTRRHNHSEPGEVVKTGSNEPALWDRISEQFEKAFKSNKSKLLTGMFGESIDTPGIAEVLAGSINIMQDRITRSRMAGDPPDIVFRPRLSHLGLMEFDRGDEAIAEGRASVERMQSALDDVMSTL